MNMQNIAGSGEGRGLSAYVDGVVLALDFLDEIQAATLNGDPVRNMLAHWLERPHGEARAGFLAALSEYIGQAQAGCVLNGPELAAELQGGEPC